MNNKNMKSKYLKSLFFCGIILFLFFPTKLASAANEKLTCTYDGVEVTYHTWIFKRETTKATITLVLTENGTVETRYEYPSGQKEMPIFGFLTEKTWMTDTGYIQRTWKNGHITAEVLAQGCPSTIEVEQDANYQIGTKTLYIGLPNDELYGKEYSLTATFDYSICNENEIEKLKNSYIGTDGTITNYRNKMNEYDTLVKQVNPDENLLKQLTSELAQLEKDIDAQLSSSDKTYGFLVDEKGSTIETSFCDKYDNARAEIIEELREEQDRFDGLANLAANNTNLSEEARRDIQNIADTAKNGRKDYQSNQFGDGSGEINCDAIDPELVDTLNQIFNIVRIIVPITIIGLGAFDFGQAVIANDQDALKKATSKFIKRCIAGVIIFFLPTLIKLLLTMPGIKDIIKVDDPLCNVK